MPAEQKPSEDIIFFGSPDRKGKTMEGRIGSEYPAWMKKQQIEEMEESIARKERELKQKLIPYDEVPYAEAELEREKERLYKINQSKPKLSAVDKDRIAKEYKRLSREVGGSMFTRSEMKIGTVSAHEEARRMVEPIIECQDESLARSCNVIPINGKISRNQATKIWKICGHALGEGGPGEATNVETLRKDKRTARTGA